MPAAVHVHLQLRIVGDDGTVFTDSEILRLEKSDHRLEAVGLSIGESKTLQSACSTISSPPRLPPSSAGTAAVRPAAVSCAAKESTRSSFAPCSAMSPSPVHAFTAVAANQPTARPSAR